MCSKCNHLSIRRGCNYYTKYDTVIHIPDVFHLIFIIFVYNKISNNKKTTEVELPQFQQNLYRL